MPARIWGAPRRSACFGYGGLLPVHDSALAADVKQVNVR
jgi:hypothetical protein